MSTRVVTLEQYRRIRAVKAARAALPTDAELSIELGLKIDTIQTVLYREIKRYERAPL